MVNEKRTILAEDGPAYKKLIIRTKEYEGSHFLDLRYYYFDKKKSEFFPTKKGITLTKSNYLTVKKVIEKNHEQVMDWLGVGYLPDHVASRQESQEKAYEQSQYISHEVAVEAEEFERDPNFFCVEHQGGNNKVTINTSHPWVKKILDLVESGELGERGVSLLAEIIAAYSTAKNKLYDSPSSHPEVLFEQLEYDWSNYLKESEG